MKKFLLIAALVVGAVSLPGTANADLMVVGGTAMAAMDTTDIQRMDMRFRATITTSGSRRTTT